jgi:hypothetical protein
VREPDGLTESARNRLLRRIDWRFVLPNPHPKVSICFGNKQIARALALVSGRVVDRAEPPLSDVCDLAVTLNPDRATLRAAWASLAPGGVCYSEWYSPLAGGVRGVRRRLRAAGFNDVTCYWAWPWPSLARTRFWIPLEAPAALQYFFDSRPRAPSRLRRFARAVGRSLLTYATLRLVPFPICAVAHKLEQPAPQDQQSVLLLTGGTRTIHKVVGLVFEEPDRHPRAIIKWPRVPEAVHLLEQEAAALRAVQLLRPGGISGVPSVLFCEHDERGFRLGETALTGVPLYTQLHRGNARSLALQATDWLVDLAGELRPRPRAAGPGELVAPVLAEFEATFGSVVDPTLLRQTRAILKTLDGCPLVCEHRDFSPWNVLRTPTGDFAVLDWEGAELDGLPALDLLYFLAHLGFFLDGAYATGRYRESYRASLNPATLIGSIRADALARYQDRLDLDPALMVALRVFVWLVHARSEYQRLVADATPRGVDPQRLRRAGFVALWKEELRQISAPRAQCS